MDLHYLTGTLSTCSPAYTSLRIKPTSLGLADAISSPYNLHLSIIHIPLYLLCSGHRPVSCASKTWTSVTLRLLYLLFLSCKPKP